MGGKTKQRVKSNAKPSSSSRSAELLGSTGFVGFAAHADLGIVPYAPGFSTFEALSDPFDGNISTDFQLVFRKMSKKDPKTKKKALLEFVELVNKSELQENKSVLPIWPKFYQNLSTDTEHIVRELAQTALRALVSKCKRNVAPFIKQLVPHWLMSQFDNYAPSASMATLSFRETFAGNVDRTQEVLLHCQAEIIGTAMRYLTFHTPSTLSSGKSLEPEAAEQKYQRAVVGCLKMLSYFIEKTHDNAENATKVMAKLKELVENKKFWSLSTHKTTNIRAAWFEFMYNILQIMHFKEILEPIKSQLLALCFKNIDQTDATIAALAWGCVLLIQDSDDNWHKSVNLQSKILPKVFILLRNGFNRNATAIAPNLLPFFSKLTLEIFEENNYYKFCERFFSEFKESITNESPYSMNEMSAIIKSKFECIRYLSQKLNQCKERSSEQDALGIWIVKENLIGTVIWFLEKKCPTIKYYFQELSALIAFWASQIIANENQFYMKLLETFWQLIAENTISNIRMQDVCEKYLENLSLLMKDIQIANPYLEKQKIKFHDQVENDDEKKLSNARHDFSNDYNDANKNTQHNKILYKELKCLAIELGKLCMEIRHERQSSIKYIQFIRHLVKMFNDREFFESLSREGTITATLNDLTSSFESESSDDEMQELLVNVIFEILQNVEAVESLDYIQSHLLNNSRRSVKILVLQRLLAYPFCNEPTVRDIIAQSNISSLIIEIAREALNDNTKEKFNILHKCFFQVETGEILINQLTVDGILKIFCQALYANDEQKIIDACGSFLAQTMPVFCAGENASQNVKNDVFLHLFEMTIKYLECNESISEDTLWEITTCWQDTLSSGDIILDKILLQSCCQIIDKYIQNDDLKPSLVDNMADALSKLIMCSTEYIKDKKTRQNEIDHTLEAVFYSKSLEAKNINYLEDLCDILEATKCLNSIGSCPVNADCLINVQIIDIFKRSLLNLSTLKKLMCKAQSRSEPSDEECSEDYCDMENLLTEWSELTLRKMMEYLSIAAVGDSIVNNSLYLLDHITEEFILILSETVKVIMSNECDIISKLCESLIERASKNGTNRYCRVIPYILLTPTYTRFEENSIIIFEETLCNRFIDDGSFEAYISSLQYLLPKLSSKAITMQNPIMRCDPPQSWIKAAMFRCLIKNNFDNVTSNEAKDKSIPIAALQFINDMIERNQKNKDILLYNSTLHDKPFCNVVNVIEYINLFGELIEKFPYQMTLTHWDALRLGLSSWILTASKNLIHFSNPAVFLFIARVVVLYEKLKNFIINEKQKSSSTTIVNVIDEWENLFALEVDLVLFKIFYKLCDENENSIDSGCYALLMEQIVPAVSLIDYNFVYSANKDKNRLSDLCNFLLKRLSNSLYPVRICCAYILRQMTPYFVAEDVLNYEKNSENFSSHSKNPSFHFLNHFDDYLMRYSLPIAKYLKEFSFKLNEINEFQKIDRNEAMSYFLLWDCIINACAKSPVSLRSIYTSWLHENRHEENFLHFLFRAMPTDILKNHDSKTLNGDVFKSLDFSQILRDSKIGIEKFSCHMYTEILGKLPALVRKWWNECASRQKTFVDKLTTNFVSTLIVSEELKAISNRRDKHENMQVTVHNSTREVLAVYSIDDARMELVITLPANYPLGAVKVECGKQIGGRSSSRNIGMQLSIFLTHQNGTIFDGLTLWKGNLDKKFEGVEECYICYTVIHQDTCQLPKLSCKTCKKKFHGPCLYKWFTTSSKSSCPICRNVF